MKRKVLKSTWILALCTTLCLGACTPAPGIEGETTGVSTEETTIFPMEETTQQGTTNTPPVIDVLVNKNLVELNFFGVKEQAYGDAGLTIIEENGKRILKAERISFAEDIIPTKEGKKWDSATNAWVTAGDMTTAERMYSIAFKESFTEGDLAVKFKFKRGGGENQSICIKPKGATKAVAGIFIEKDSLKIGNTELKMDSTDFEKFNLSADEWYEMDIRYSISHNGFAISVVVTDEYGDVMASIGKTPIENAVTSISGLDLVDSSTLNIADYGKAAPENPTSIWYMKDLTAKVNPMETGDRIKVKSRAFDSSADVQAVHLTINGHQTVRPYFGRYSLLPDNSGFICGTIDNTFYLYEFETQELVYLDKSLNPGEEQLALHCYVNPITGNVFYMQKNAAGCTVIYRINPKTCEKTMMYEAEDSSLQISPEVSHDEKYIAYMRGGWKPANVKTYFGRINMETDTIEYEHSVTYGKEYCVNHLVLNPVYPDILFFHREKLGDASVVDQSNTLNFVTGEILTYEQPGDYSGHAIWTIDGENVQLNCTQNGVDGFALLTKDLKQVIRIDLGTAAHPMIDESKTWIASDNTQALTLRNLYDSSKMIYICRNMRGYGSEKGHPFDAHSEISRDGKIIMWGVVNADGVLGIAWTSNPFLE